MAKVIVGRRQQEVFAREHPKPVYSRVVTCELNPQSEMGPVFTHTGKLGTDLWVYRVKVWGIPRVPSLANITVFRVLTGTTKATTAEDILTWENLLPVRDQFGKAKYWVRYDGSDIYEWTMARFFEGKARMLGMWGKRIGEGDDTLYASFEISEG